MRCLSLFKKPFCNLPKFTLSNYRFMAGFVVTFKEDCPHVSLFDQNKPLSMTIKDPCIVCKDTKENWCCASCFTTLCSRYVNKHMLHHYQADPGHCIAVSYSDLSLWCFECEDYVTSPVFEKLLDHLYKDKFCKEPPTSVPPIDVTVLPAANINNLNNNVDLYGDSENDTPSPSIEKKTEEIDKNKNDASEPSIQNYPSSEIPIDTDMEYLTQKIQEIALSEEIPKEPLPKVLDNVNLQGIVDYILQGKARNIIVMVGAGISVSSGIPDFRTPGSGLFDNLQKFNLPYPEAIFSIDFFKESPQAFYSLAKELYPGMFKPSPAHYFLQLLNKKNLLSRVFSQNIDSLELVAGLPTDKLVQAHGGFAQAHCIDCHQEHSFDFVKQSIFSDQIPHCSKCQGLVKPDIVFYGEALPERFFQLSATDFPLCDLLIVMGTSLTVHPFAGLVEQAPTSIPRLLINNEKVGMGSNLTSFIAMLMGHTGNGFKFDDNDNTRDVFLQSSVDEGVIKLCQMLGWEKEFNQLLEERSKVTAESFTLN